jgi:amino-acid N-acetyltransferase
VFSAAFQRVYIARMNIHPANSDDLSAIRALLETERLPASDVDERAIEHFLIWRDGSDVKGIVGLELYGDVVFLRSLVVVRHARGSGAGAALTQAAEMLAASLGASTVYLLTMSAEHFFSVRGYSKIDRRDAPQSIQGTAQFSGLCPSTAVLMMKPLR